MEPGDMDDKNVESITVEILRSIRDELRGFRADVNARFERVDARFEQVDARFAQVDGRFAQVDARFAQVDSRFERLAQAHVALREDMNAGFQAVLQQGDRRFVDHEGRLRRLEAHLGLTP